MITDLIEHRLEKKEKRRGGKKEKEKKSFQVVAVHMGWNQAGLFFSHFYK